MKKAVILFLSFLMIDHYGTVAQASVPDSLLQLLPFAKADTNAVNLYIELGEYYLNAGDLKLSSEYQLKARNLSRQLNYLHGLYYSSDYYSIILAKQGLYDSAVVVNKETMEIALKHSDDYQAAIEKWNIGAHYGYKGYNETAMVYFIESLDYFKKANRLTEIGELYNEIQVVYIRMNNYKEAIVYGEKALEILPDSLSKSYAYNLLNLSVNYYSLYPPQNEKALAYLQKVLHIAALNKNACLEAEAYNCIAIVYLQTNRMDESETYYLKALRFFTEDNYPKDFCIANIGLAKIAMFRNNLKEAEARARKNLAISHEHGIRREERNALSLLWELSVARKDWLGRNRYKASVDSIQTAVVNETMLHAVEDSKIEHETEKKEMQITMLEREKLLILWIGITGVIVLLSGVATLFFVWRWTVQKKRLSEQKVKQLQQENQLVAAQALLDGETQERARLARDLHDGIGSILAAAKYNLSDINKTNALGDIELERFTKSMSLLDDAMREMRLIAHHLMPETLVNYGLKSSIADFCSSLPHVKFTYYGDESRLNPKMEVMIYRIMHELVSNALKHSGASKILVDIVRYDDNIALTVQDNGCGFDSAAESKGMGLQNIRTRVAAYNGNLFIDTKLGVGTEINIELKIKDQIK